MFVGTPTLPVEMSVFMVNKTKIPSRESVFALVYCYIEKGPGQTQKVSGNSFIWHSSLFVADFFCPNTSAYFVRVIPKSYSIIQVYENNFLKRLI